MPREQHNKSENIINRIKGLRKNNPQTTSSPRVYKQTERLPQGVSTADQPTIPLSKEFVDQPTTPSVESKHPYFKERIAIDRLIPFFAHPQEEAVIVPELLSALVLDNKTATEVEVEIARHGIFATMIERRRRQDLGSTAIHLCERFSGKKPESVDDLSPYKTQLESPRSTRELLRDMSHGYVFQERMFSQLCHEIFGSDPDAQMLARYTPRLQAGEDILEIAEEMKRGPEALSVGYRRQIVTYKGKPVNEYALQLQ